MTDVMSKHDYDRACGYPHPGHAASQTLFRLQSPMVVTAMSSRPMRSPRETPLTSQRQTPIPALSAGQPPLTHRRSITVDGLSSPIIVHDLTLASAYGVWLLIDDNWGHTHIAHTAPSTKQSTPTPWPYANTPPQPTATTGQPPTCPAFSSTQSDSPGPHKPDTATSTSDRPQACRPTPHSGSPPATTTRRPRPWAARTELATPLTVTAEGSLSGRWRRSDCRPGWVVRRCQGTGAGGRRLGR